MFSSENLNEKCQQYVESPPLVLVKITRWHEVGSGAQYGPKSLCSSLITLTNDLFESQADLTFIDPA